MNKKIYYFIFICFFVITVKSQMTISIDNHNFLIKLDQKHIGKIDVFKKCLLESKELLLENYNIDNAFFQKFDFISFNYKLDEFLRQNYWVGFGKNQNSLLSISLRFEQIGKKISFRGFTNNDISFKNIKFNDEARLLSNLNIFNYFKKILNEDSKNYKLVRIKTNIPDLTTNHSYSSMEYTFSRVTDGYYSKDNIIEIELNSDGELYRYNNNYIQNTYPAVINITRKEAEEIALEKIKQIREFRREILYEEEVIRPKKRLQETFDTEPQRRPYLGVYREYIAEKEEMINQEIKYEVIDYFDTRIITETDEIKILLYKNKYRKDFNEISILYSKEIIERAMNQKKPVYLRPNYLYVWTEECLPESGILPKIETEDNKPYNYREMKSDDKHKYNFVVTDKERLAYIIPIKLNAEDGVLNTIYEKILTVYIDAETGEVIGGLF